jgi:hypothetical protein
MTIWTLYLIIAFILFGGLAFIWLIVRLGKISSGHGDNSLENLGTTAESYVEKIFDQRFREELKNRASLHFQKIINDNAEFLQQDLRLTSAQLNDFMKTELTNKVHGELEKYEQSINDARDLAIDSIKRTSLALEDQRKVLSEQVEVAISAEKASIIAEFENQLAEIVSHYIVAAIGREVALEDQLEFILADLEANKKAIIEDIRNV